MADKKFLLGDTVNFINRQGVICAAIVVKVFSDTFANLRVFDPDAGVDSGVLQVPYSEEIAPVTFHSLDLDMAPKTEQESRDFKLKAVEANGSLLDGPPVMGGLPEGFSGSKDVGPVGSAMDVPNAPTGTVVQNTAEDPATQMLPTDGKEAEKHASPAA